jgi:hypothetical protein
MEKLENSKFTTVIRKNTFYFYSSVFYDKYEAYLNSINDTLLVLKNEIDMKGLNKQCFEELLLKDNGLRALLALTGFSNESLKRLITVIRIKDDKTLSKLTNRQKWEKTIIDSKENITEWSNTKIEKLIKYNSYFRRGIVNLFFEGSTIPFLSQTLPLFEIKKLSISKLKFEIPAMIDTLVRYKEKGSYSAKIENNPEYFLASILKNLNITFEKGDLSDLLKNEFQEKRTMDFIIPNKKNPKIIIESSFLTTTSSGQGDKSKTEQNIRKLIYKYYPESKFIGFIDGIGWYVRKNDLKRMVTVYDEVFTYHKTELERFSKYVERKIK